MKELKKMEKQMDVFVRYFEKRYFEENSDDSYWVADEVGGVYAVADYFFSMGDMVQFIRHDYSEEDMFDYYQYAIDSYEAKVTVCIRDWRKLVKQNMKIKLEEAQELAWLSVGEEEGGFKIVHEKQGEDRRWSRTDTKILEKGGKTYKLFQEIGLTEMQDISGTDEFPQCKHNETEFEIPEVQRKEKVVTKVWYE